MTKPIFYRDVADAIATDTPSTLGRDRAALHHWMTAYGYGDEDEADALVVPDHVFETAVEQLKTGLTGRNGEPANRAVRNQRVAGLRRVRRIALQLYGEGAEAQTTLKGAIYACRRALGISQYKMSKRYGSAFHRYELGLSIPQERQRSRLERLARDAGKPSDFVTRHMPTPPHLKAEKAVRLPTYSLSAQGWVLPGIEAPKTQAAPLPAGVFRTQLVDWIAYKTAATPPRGLRRATHSRWTENGAGINKSQQQQLQRIDGFVGWLVQELGVPLERLRLPMLGDAVLAEAYAAFLHARESYQAAQIWMRVARSFMLGVPQTQPKLGVAGYVRQQRRQFYGDVAGSGAGDAEGYLAIPGVRALYVRDIGFPDRQQTAAEVLAEVYCAEHDLDDLENVGSKALWDTWCESNEARVLRFSEQQPLRKRGSRTPQQKVDALIAATPERRERPIRVLYDLLDGIGQDIERYAQSAGTQKRVLELECNRTLAAFAGGLPLREMTARHVKLHPDLMTEEGRAHLPTGYQWNLWKAEDGRYWYSADADMFKTREAMKRQNVFDYTVQLPDWVTPFLDRYFERMRGQTIGARAGSPYMWCALVNPHHASAEQLRRPVSERCLGERMQGLMKRYLLSGATVPETAVTPLGESMRYHWVRHLVATDLLATSPEALAFVAHVLNISLEMVRRTYDRSKPADAVRFAGRHQDAVMGGLSRAA
jgi:hypothetical protein